MNILITGGTGYIGSHTALLLAQEGHRVVVFDNLSNSTAAVLKRLALLGAPNIVFEQGDVCTSATLAPCLLEHEIEAVIHLAGTKGAREAWSRPLTFHTHHTVTNLNLFSAMGVMERPTLIYGSSAAVYGPAPPQPLEEEQTLVPWCPYGSTHQYAETILKDMTAAHPEWRVGSLRLFDVAGAHPSGLMGEEMGSSVGLTTQLARVAAGRSLALPPNGHRLHTPAGTTLHDYVHVMDVAQAHLDALAYTVQQGGFEAFNVGSGQVHSELDLVKAFEQLSGQSIAVQPGDPSPGQHAHRQACLEKTRLLLGWAPTHSFQDLCQSAWNHLLSAMETGAGAWASPGYSLPR